MIIVYLFFSVADRKKSQEVKSGERGGHSTGLHFQSNFRVSYCPNTFSHEMNNVQAHQPGEKV